MTAPATERDLTLSDALLAATQRQWQALTGHPLVTEAFAGHGAAIAIGLWAKQRAILSGLKFQAIRNLVAYYPPAELSGLLVVLLKKGEDERQMYGEILAELGASLPAGPSLTTDGYGSNLIRRSAEGPRQGLTAVTFAARADLEISAKMQQACPPESRWRPLIGTWPGDGFGDVVDGLCRSLDQDAPAGAPLEATIRALLPVAERTLEFELALLRMCWSRGEWQL